MPSRKRSKTIYPGVYFVESSSSLAGKQEKVYYIMYRKNGKLIEEKAGGRFKDNMSPAKASQLRTLKITGKLEANKERRQRINDRVTMDYLFKVFRKHKTPQVSP